MPTRINLQDAQEVQRWCAWLGCNEMRLRNAVLAVGDSPRKVYDYLHKPTL